MGGWGRTQDLIYMSIWNDFFFFIFYGQDRQINYIISLELLYFLILVETCSLECILLLVTSVDRVTFGFISFTKQLANETTKTQTPLALLWDTDSIAGHSLEWRTCELHVELPQLVKWYFEGEGGGGGVELGMPHPSHLDMVVCKPSLSQHCAGSRKQVARWVSRPVQLYIYDILCMHNQEKTDYALHKQDDRILDSTMNWVLVLITLRKMY